MRSGRRTWSSTCTPSASPVGARTGSPPPHGVMTWLEARGLGFPIGPADASPPRVVPVVPAAVIFDLGRGGAFEQPSRCPLRRTGCRVAPGSTSGVWGRRRCRHRGQGRRAPRWCRHREHGRPDSRHRRRATDRDRRRGARRGQRQRLGRRPVERAAVGTERPDSPAAAAAEREVLLAMLDGQAAPRPSTAAHGLATTQAERGRSDTGRLNTTIGVVATSAALSKAEVGKFASVAHDGMARAIRPAHSMFDGDTIFGLATGRRRAHRHRDPTSGARLAQRRVQPVARRGGRDVRRSVHPRGAQRLARSASLPSYFDLCPSARPTMSDAPAILSTPADMRTWSMRTATRGTNRRARADDGGAAPWSRRTHPSRTGHDRRDRRVHLRQPVAVRSRRRLRSLPPPDRHRRGHLCATLASMRSTRRSPARCTRQASARP